MHEKEKILQEQQKKIQDQDSLLEQKFQQKQQSEYLIEILETLEIILAVFKSQNPRIYFDANFGLKRT